MLNKTNPIFALIRGFLKSFAYIFKPKVTIKYPREKSKVSDKFRGKHYLERDIFGNEKCIACKLCETVCPAKAIKVDTIEKDGKNFPVEYIIDAGRCCYCGLCEQACPVKAIKMSKIYEDIAFDITEKNITKKILLNRGKNGF